MRLASEPLHLPFLARCPALGVSLMGGSLLPRPTHRGRVRTAAYVWRSSAHLGRRSMRARERRHAAGTARTRSAATAMLTYSRLRIADAPCVARQGASTCILEESGGHPGSRPRVPTPPEPAPLAAPDSDGF